MWKRTPPESRRRLMIVDALVLAVSVRNTVSEWSDHPLMAGIGAAISGVLLITLVLLALDRA
jgi:hypothetical protein